MTLDIAWLNQVLADPQRCNEGIKRLYELFKTSPVVVGLDTAESGDVVQGTVMSIWQHVKNGRTVPNLSYLTSALRNKKIDVFRRRKRERDLLHNVAQEAVPEQTDPRLEPAPVSAVDDDRKSGEVKAAFEKLRDRAIAARKPHLRDKLRADCDQLWELTLGLRKMDAEIDAELARGASEARETIQARLLQRHQQARKALSAALDTLVAEAEISSDQRPFYEMLLMRLLRRQNQRARASRKQAP